MDSKAILSKHQNDFSQYLLRNLEHDELRAIRGALPKFRNDQKRQLDWVESLESKIDQSANAPKKPPPPKLAAPKFKPKPASKAVGAPPGDMFAELLAKRKKLGSDGAEEEAPEPKKEEVKVGTLKLAKSPSIKGNTSQTSSTPAPKPPLAPKPPPPPPPPPAFL